MAQKKRPEASGTKPMPRKEAAENAILDFFLLPFLLHTVLPALKGGIPACIPVILFAVVVLVKFPGGVLIDQPLDQLRSRCISALPKTDCRSCGSAPCSSSAKNFE